MSNSVFSYPIDECDVLDRSNLEKFRVFKADALDMLINDELSIVNQFYALSWETRVFHLINESWKIAKNYDETYGVQNPIISEMLLNGYVFSQTLGIRKLTDSNKYSDKNKHVNSVPSLIHKIGENINMFTRENFVCGDGLPYDFGAVKSKDHAEGIKKALENGGSHASWKPIKGPLAWSTSERFHIEFDKLSKVSADKRTRQDTVSHDVLDNIDKPWLKKEDIFSIEQAWDIKNRDMDKWEDEFKNMLNQILV